LQTATWMPDAEFRSGPLAADSRRISVMNSIIPTGVENTNDWTAICSLAPSARRGCAKSRDLGGRQHAAMARLRAPADFELDHLTWSSAAVSAKRSDEKVPSGLRAPKYPEPIPHMMSPPFSRWTGKNPPSPVSWAKSPALAPLLRARMAFGLKAPEAHAREEILAHLWSYVFEQEAQMGRDWIIAQHRVARLDQIVGAEKLSAR
jgi:hypothetical protein